MDAYLGLNPEQLFMSFFSFRRRVDDVSDEFKGRVDELVKLHGPADALERATARRMAADVLVHGIIEANNRQAAGLPPIDASKTSPFRRTLSQSIAAVLQRLLAAGTSEAPSFGDVIVETCFGLHAERPYLDTGEIPWLVGTAYGLAIELRENHPALAERIVLDPPEVPSVVL